MPLTAFAAASSGPSPGTSREGERISSCSRLAAEIIGSVPLTARFASMPGISRRLISLVPSKIRFTRASRYCRSAGVVADEAIAAVDLHVFVDDKVDHLAARDLENRGLDGELLERVEHRAAVVGVVDRAVDQAGGAIEHRFDGILADHHLGELVADRPERPDRLAELPAI